MKIFLSALENAQSKICSVAELMVSNGVQMRWNLMSYFSIKSKPQLGAYIRDNTDEILIDSGAFSFQRGSSKTDWEEYTHRYAAFIKEFDRPNVLGYFEMDVDNIIGYDKVLYLRDIIMNESGHSKKIIPVWHKGRGIDDYLDMCENSMSDIVAITGFKNEDIKDEQYLMFLKEAHRNGKRLHCLGMTRREILDVVPFDYVDSSSWVQSSIHGSIRGRKVTQKQSQEAIGDVFALNYLSAMDMQRHYYNHWRQVSED